MMWSVVTQSLANLAAGRVCQLRTLLLRPDTAQPAQPVTQTELPGVLASSQYRRVVVVNRKLLRINTIQFREVQAKS